MQVKEAIAELRRFQKWAESVDIEPVKGPELEFENEAAELGFEKVVQMVGSQEWVRSSFRRNNR